MGVVILLDHRDCHPNSFQPACFSSRDSIISTSARSILSFLNGVCFIRPQVAFVFPHPTLFFKDSFILIKYPFIHVKSLHSFPSMFLSGDSQEDTNGALTSSLFVLFLLQWIKFKLCRSYLFLVSNVFLVPVHLLIIHFSLFNCSGVMKISQKIQVSILNSLKFF